MQLEEILCFIDEVTFETLKPEEAGHERVWRGPRKR